MRAGKRNARRKVEGRAAMDRTFKNYIHIHKLEYTNGTTETRLLQTTFPTRCAGVYWIAECKVYLLEEIERVVSEHLLEAGVSIDDK